MPNFIIRSIPNTLTCLNLFSGCVACVLAFQADYPRAFLFIFLGAVFDFFDGMAARLLAVHSPIGKDLDSLADDVSFGVAPSAVIFSLLKEMPCPSFLGGVAPYVPYWAFLIAVFSALRLAKFNNDTRQATSFIGLPVPANALFWASLVAGMHDVLVADPLHLPCVLVLVCLSAGLLVSEIPMFSLKFKDLSWQGNKLRFLFLLCCVPLLWLGLCSFAAIILWYILLSLLTGKRK